MSHSWYDDPELKYEKLTILADIFKKKYGRYPTFWIDKLCIDQKNISDGLKVLPINVMACKRMLVLCGPTYLKRLWCAWELCTLFSFMSEEQGLKRVEMVLVEKEINFKVMQRLTSFRLANAHCYDPNEESRIRRVVGAVGEARFNKRITRLTDTLCDKIQALIHGRRRNGVMSPAIALQSSGSGSFEPPITNSGTVLGGVISPAPREDDRNYEIIGYGSLLGGDGKNKGAAANALVASAKNVSRLTTTGIPGIWGRNPSASTSGEANPERRPSGTSFGSLTLRNGPGSSARVGSTHEGSIGHGSNSGRGMAMVGSPTNKTEPPLDSTTDDEELELFKSNLSASYVPKGGRGTGKPKQESVDDKRTAEALASMQQIATSPIAAKREAGDEPFGQGGK
jgi:hypothetical protein